MELFKKSNWIWLNEYSGVNTYVRFFEEIESNDEKNYTLYISAETNYALYVNDELVNFGQYSDYGFDKVYDILELSAYIKAGKNSLRVDCWHQGEDSSTKRNETAGVIYELYSDDSLILYSSEQTNCSPISGFMMGNAVEHITGQLGYSFRFDSRTEDSTEVFAEVVDMPIPAKSRSIEKLNLGADEPSVLSVSGMFSDKHKDESLGARISHADLGSYGESYDRYLPSADGIVLSSPDGYDGVYAVIDTHRENAGICSLDFEVDDDCEVIIAWGEHLNDLRVRANVGGRVFAAQYYAHKGRNKFVNPFRRIGMRYLEVHFYTRSVKLYYAGIKATDYPLSHDVKFTCADKLHTKIYEVSKRTLLMSMHEHYEDCPWREQALYTMDSRNQMLCGYYSFKEFKFARASLVLMAQSIREDNMLELCSPARVSITIPSFSAIYLTQVYEYLKYSGDMTVLDEVLPAMLRIADEFIKRTDNAKGLIQCFKEQKYWNFYEWQDGLEGSIGGYVKDEKVTYDAPLCAFVSFGLRSLSEVLKMLGEEEKAEYYHSKHISINENINRVFWNPEKGAYASYLNLKGELSHYCELTNSLVIYADAAEGEREREVLENLSKENLITVTLSHSIFKYDALMRDRKYARRVFDDIADKWSYMLYNNATTFWETIKGQADFGDAGSLCHGWSAIPIYFYHEYALKMPGEETGLYECMVCE